ncbi:MAG TPA: Rid family hydrolase [Thermoanaerobaculia bacterium]|nr:Rid family hydrolase [Thermoanaerobaculia bacterium]
MVSRGTLGLAALGLLLVASRGGRRRARPRVARIPSPATAGLGLPFPGAVRVGDLLLLSGAIGHLPGALTLAPGGVAAETHQALDNLEAVLRQEGLDLGDLVQCTLMLADIGEWPQVNAVWVERFAGARPARSAFGTSGLALGARIEIDGIALAR